MSLNDTPSADRIHIAFFGMRNAGKSSIMNAVTGQSLSIVSDTKGTTTDPVYKTMELLPAGPVVMIDTPGLDDEGALGKERVKKALQVLRKTDVAVLVVDAAAGKRTEDRQLIARLKAQNIPYLVVYNKIDLCGGILPEPAENEIAVSAATGARIPALKERIAALAVPETPSKRLIGDLVQPLDFVVLVVPIDKAAPKGRLILPQQQTIRDLLEQGAVPIVVRDTELSETLSRLQGQIKLVITDSQAFQTVSAATPEEIPLTSFSILFARYKGSLETAVRGAAALSALQDGDRILIAEGCTHHKQCDDIGSVKLPRWINQFTGKMPSYDFTNGREFPEDLSPYRLVVHCGGCMLNEREMQFRLQHALSQGIPMTNYGILIAYMQGILRRSLGPFPEVQSWLPQ